MAFHFIRNFRNCENLPILYPNFQADTCRSEENLKKVFEGSIGGVAAENSKAAAERGRAIKIGNFRLAGSASRKTPTVFREAIRSTAAKKISSGVRADAAYSVNIHMFLSSLVWC